MISTGTLCDGEDDGRTMIKVEVLVVKAGLTDDANKGVEDTADIMEVVRIDVIELDVCNTSDEVSIIEVLDTSDSVEVSINDDNTMDVGTVLVNVSKGVTESVSATGIDVDDSNIVDVRSTGDVSDTFGDIVNVDDSAIVDVGSTGDVSDTFGDIVNVDDSSTLT